METCAFCQGRCLERNHRCSGCKAVSYCGTECQKKDWKKGHKKECVVKRDKRLLRKVQKGVAKNLGVKLDIKNFTENDPELFYVVATITDPLRCTLVQHLCDMIEDAFSASPELFNMACGPWNGIFVAVMTVPKSCGDLVKQCAKEINFSLGQDKRMFCEDSKGNKVYFPLTGPNVWWNA